MPTSYSIDADVPLLRFALSGTSDTWNLEELAAALASEPRVQGGLRILCDLSGVEGVSSMPTVRGILGLAASLGERIVPCRCAVVAPRDSTYGMARAASVYAGEVPGLLVRAFRTAAPAETWLFGDDDGED